ncbi:MAG: hypothetical protein HYV59_12720 [Planctomycetes bacterium]|nr:hypothetical protein [Planctomycetota bacterium]
MTVVLIFHSVYRFLPDKLQKRAWIKISAIGSVSIILVFDIYKNTQEYRGQIYADISKDGTILKGKNFPWKIIKMNNDGNIIYVISERYGDASDVSIISEKTNEIYNGGDGIVIKFKCPEEEISNFRIKIKN